MSTTTTGEVKPPEQIPADHVGWALMALGTVVHNPPPELTAILLALANGDWLYGAQPLRSSNPDYPWSWGIIKETEDGQHGVFGRTGRFVTEWVEGLQTLARHAPEKLDRLLHTAYQNRAVPK